MDKTAYYNTCIAILNSCWNSMRKSKEDWEKAFKAFGEVANRAGQQDVTDFAVKCFELLEMKHKGE